MNSLFEDLKSRALMALDERTYWNQFDSTTYINMNEYVRFQKDKDLKRLWCIRAGNRWKVNADELYAKCPDECPIFHTPLDYGLGYNMILREAKGRNNDWFRPSVDHIKPKSSFPELQNEITNMVVVSNRANRLKSNIESWKELEIFTKGYCDVYGKNI